MPSERVFLFIISLMLWISYGSLVSFHHSSIFHRNIDHQRQQHPSNLECEDQEFVVRQVPGDGGCLFHAIASWITFIKFRSHVKFDWRTRRISNELRKVAAKMLLSNQTLYIENDDFMTAYTLLDVVSMQYNISQYDYCRIMLDSKTWGGGPEIIAISNHLKCPIYIYQLNTTECGNSKRMRFCLTLFTKVGSPRFDNVEPLHLLCCDGRFPDLKPGEQKLIGDHFLALFPCHTPTRNTSSCSSTAIPYANVDAYFDQYDIPSSCSIAIATNASFALSNSSISVSAK